MGVYATALARSKLEDACWAWPVARTCERGEASSSPKAIYRGVPEHYTSLIASWCKDSPASIFAMGRPIWAVFFCFHFLLYFFYFFIFPEYKIKFYKNMKINLMYLLKIETFSKQIFLNKTIFQKSEHFGCFRYLYTF